MNWTWLFTQPQTIQAVALVVAALVAALGVGWQLSAQRRREHDQRAQQMRRDIFGAITAAMLDQTAQVVATADPEVGKLIVAMKQQLLPLLQSHLVARPATIAAYMAYGRQQLSMVLSPDVRLPAPRARALAKFFALGELQVPILLSARVDLGFGRLDSWRLKRSWRRHFRALREWLAQHSPPEIDLEPTAAESQASGEPAPPL